MKRTALVGLLALVSWSAQAAQNVPGWRVGAAASFVTFSGDNNTNPPLGNDWIDDSSVGAKLWAQYRFDERFAVEAAYHNTGDLEGESNSDEVEGSLKLSFDGFSLQGLVFIPFESEEIQPYLKAGMYDFDDELSVNGTVTSNSSESSWVFGGGAIIDIADNFSIRADGEWFDAEAGGLWEVNLGIQYAFGGTAQAAAPAAAAPPPPPPPAAEETAPAVEESAPAADSGSAEGEAAEAGGPPADEPPAGEAGSAPAE